MTLTLRAVSLNDHPLTQPITAHFDAEGGSIGRADHNTLALPSPERHISRQQAEISFSGRGYAIRNVGSANPIIVRGQALARGESAPLGHHDQVRIGGYLLEVIQEESTGREADTVIRGRAAVDAATPGAMRRALPSTNPGMAPRSIPGAGGGGLGDLNAPLSRDNPFASLLGDSAAGSGSTPRAAPAMPKAEGFDALLGAPPAAAGIAAGSAAWAPAPTPPARQLLPDDFDPFAPPAAAAAPAAPAPTDANLFEGLIPAGPRVSIDEAFGLDPAAARSPLADFMADLAPAPRAPAAEGWAGAAPVPVDPLAALGFAGTPVPSTAPTLPDHVPALRAAFVPPALKAHPQAPEVAPREAQPRPPAGPVHAPAPLPEPPALMWHGDPRELWAAFCEGAGVAVQPAQGVNPELMRLVGSMLHAAVAGTLQLMTVRATAKHELRAQVTMIQARNNNPLKFSPDARAALEQMLQPPVRGFLAGPAAMTDAMHDLVGHTIGTMAGTRAALEGVLDRFTPQQLEAKLAGKSVLDSVLPMNRKAKLWELYLQHFEAIRNEAHDDFQSLFGRAFLAAYEQQLDRLEQQDRPAQGAR